MLGHTEPGQWELPLETSSRSWPMGVVAVQQERSWLCISPTLFVFPAPEYAPMSTAWVTPVSIKSWLAHKHYRASLSGNLTNHHILLKVRCCLYYFPSALEDRVCPVTCPEHHSIQKLRKPWVGCHQDSHSLLTTTTPFFPLLGSGESLDYV